MEFADASVFDEMEESCGNPFLGAEDGGFGLRECSRPYVDVPFPYSMTESFVVGSAECSVAVPAYYEALLRVLFRLDLRDVNVCTEMLTSYENKRVKMSPGQNPITPKSLRV